MSHINNKLKTRNKPTVDSYSLKKKRVDLTARQTVKRPFLFVLEPRLLDELSSRASAVAEDCNPKRGLQYIPAPPPKIDILKVRISILILLFICVLV